MSTEPSVVSDILDGKINFAKRISPSSYYRLERKWVQEVKQHRAHFIWQRTCSLHDSASKNWVEASESIRKSLINPDIKAMPEEFDKVMYYLEERYLAGSTVDEKSRSEVNNLIGNKASRIAFKTGQSDDLKNWINAKKYVQLYYNNIVPAVLDGDLESTLNVLKAFAYSRAPENRFLIVNCFEAVIAIYYLRVKVIHDILAAGLIRWESIM